VGVLFLATLQNGLSVSGVASYWQQIITGAILIIVVASDKAQREGLRSLGLWRAGGGGGRRAAEPPPPSDTNSG
jgi:hypothetical protein